MADDYKSYRIRTTVGGNDNVLNVKLTQTYDVLEVLSLKIDQKNSYKTFRSDYGVVIGRVFANGGYGVPNAKISVFVATENSDVLEENILYPYTSTRSLGVDNVRYNLLPDFVDVACHQDVGTFPTKRYVLDNDDVIEIFDKYYTYTTTTNSAGDYMLFGIPTGVNTLHMDVDLSDIGVLSQKPRDFIYKGYNIEQFDSPTKFKSSTNLSSLVQIMSDDKDVYVYPYWGDVSETDSDIAITRCDFELAYKFEPTCVFMGSVVTDTGSNGLSKNCTPDEKSGQMSELVAGAGTIEMIRKTFDNKVEQYSVNGNQNIDENGIWCYQIPMNLDYIVTDEFGNIVPSNDPERGIPTRTRVRFRISMNDMPNDDKARNRCRYLVPNNPRFDKERYPNFSATRDVDYEFGTMTKDENYRDLFWNNVYTVKNYIPRIQTDTNVKNGKRKFGGIKLITHYGDNNPMPYNQVTTRMEFVFNLLCNIFKFILDLITILNWLISYVIGGIIGILASPFCALAKLSIFGIKPFAWIFGPVCNAFKKLIPKCVKLEGSMCGEYLTHAYTFYPGCGNFSESLGLGAWINTQENHKKEQDKKIRNKEMTNDERTIPNNSSDAQELRNCIETSLAENYKVVSFNFSNDWINGVLYMPLWFRKISPKKSYFFGIFTKKASDLWCSSERTDGDGMLNIVQPCAVDTERILEGTNNGCGKNNEGCLTAKGTLNVRYGVIVKKQTMLGQDVYYYRACEVEGDFGNNGRIPFGHENMDKDSNSIYVKLLYATDIVLLGSLNDNDLKGVPQFYKSLESTTYKLPPALLQTVNDVGENDSGQLVQTSKSEYTGRDWGNVNNDLCDESQKTSKDGGLFYGIGCGSTQMTPKSCINVSRICEFGVSLDENVPVISRVPEKETVDMQTVYDYITPDGFISYDEINNESQRSAFATLNGNFLRTVINGTSGLKEYQFKYLHVDNFDGTLARLMEKYQTKCAKLQRYNYMLEKPSKGYISFRLGIDEDRQFKYPTEVRNRNFPRFENSFYFYFGLKEGKTALDKLHKYYVADCADTINTESPVIITSQGNDWCCIGEIISDDDGNIVLNDYNGYVAFDITNVDLPCTVLLQRLDDTDKNNEREFVVNDEKVYISTFPYTENACDFDEGDMLVTPPNIQWPSPAYDSVNVRILNTMYISPQYVNTLKCTIYYTIGNSTLIPLDPDPTKTSEDIPASQRTYVYDKELTLGTGHHIIKAVTYITGDIDGDGTENVYKSSITTRTVIVSSSSNIHPTSEDDNEEETNSKYKEELKGYIRQCRDINGDRLMMVANGNYSVHFTDSNGSIWSTMITIGQKVMNCIITPSNFETPYNRLMDMYHSMSSIVWNRVFDPANPTYTTNLTRKIGGTINVSIPRDPDSGEILPDFNISIVCDDEDIDYSLVLEVHNYKVVIKQTTFSNTDALIYPFSINNGSDVSNVMGFIFGIPKGDTDYSVTVTQLCESIVGEGDETETVYLLTDNIVSETVYITDKTQYKLYINDVVDYDVIKHWRTGFVVDNPNMYSNTATIRETGDISHEWFHLSNEKNYHWYDYSEYNKIDKELVSLVKTKHKELLDIQKDELLLSAYNMAMENVFDDPSYKYATNIEGRITANAVKNYLYYGGNIYVDISKIIDGLTKVNESLSNKCIVEVKHSIPYVEYKNLVTYGKKSYESVYTNMWDNSFITVNDFNELLSYNRKEVDFYPYEFESTASETNEVITYYGYVDLHEVQNYANATNNVRENYVATKYIRAQHSNVTGITRNDLNSIDDENFDKYVPLTYEDSSHTDIGECATRTANQGTYESFVQPGRFVIRTWFNIEEITVDGDNTIGGTELQSLCSTQDYIIYKLFDTKEDHGVIPYLGYNTLQHSNKKDIYNVKTYVKVIDVVEYEAMETTEKANFEVYQYIKTVKVKTIPDGTDAQLKLSLEEYQNSLYYQNNERYVYYYYYYDTSLGASFYTHVKPTTNSTITYCLIGENVETISVNKKEKKYNSAVKLWFNIDTIGTANEEVIIGGSAPGANYKYVEIIYEPQYIQANRLNVNKYTVKEYDKLPEYGTNAYDTTITKYRNIYDNVDIKEESEYNTLDDKGKFDYVPFTYRPLRLDTTPGAVDDPLYYGEIILTETLDGDVYDYKEIDGDITVQLLEGGNEITAAEYERVDYLQDFYEPNRYKWRTNSSPMQLYQYFTGNEITLDEYEHLAYYSQRFYTILEYEYILPEECIDNEECFDNLDEDKKYLFNRFKRNGKYVYVLKISKDDYDNAETNITVEGYGDIPKSHVKPYYVNILNNMDKITDVEYNNLPSNVQEDYYPYYYEEKVGSDITIAACENEEDLGAFSNIVGINDAMISYLEETTELKMNFINAAKDAFWMSCTEESHTLTFRAVTDDKPVNYHLVYKEEVVTEDELNDTEYNALSTTDYYVSDGTTDINLTIPTICSQDELAWGNECHLISGYPDLCFARDNKSSLCTSGSTDYHWRKAFFVAVVNGKQEAIPLGDLTPQKVPTEFFGIHVLDKRVKNKLAIWANIKSIPKFYRRINDSGHEEVSVNMFGSIAGYITNGVVDTSQIVKDTNCNGYHSSFETQSVADMYDIDFYTEGTVDEDKIGLRRYVYGEKVNDVLAEEVKSNIRSFDSGFDLTNYNDDNIEALIDKVKPYENYRIQSQNCGSTKQYSILPFIEDALKIEDEFGCTITQIVDGNAEISLSKESINDSRCISWGSNHSSTHPKSLVNYDTSFLKVKIANGDDGNYTFYAFEASIKVGTSGNTYENTYPLNNASIINGANNIYKINFNNTQSVFANTASQSKYIFGTENEIIFDTELYDCLNGQAYVESSKNNKDIFFNCLKVLVNYGELQNAFTAKIGDGKATESLFSTDDVDMKTLILTRSKCVLCRKEGFISRMGRKSESYSRHVEHLFYDPESTGFIEDDNTAPTTETCMRDLGEYDEYRGFSRNGEFGLNIATTVYGCFHAITALIGYQEDGSEEGQNQNGTKVHYGKFIVKYHGRAATIDSHKPFYIVAISNNGVCRAISPVYDYRVMRVRLSKTYYNAKYYYSVKIYAMSSYIETESGHGTYYIGEFNDPAYYCYYYPYQIINYDIHFTDVSNDETEVQIGECSSTYTQHHSPDSTLDTDFNFENYIEYPKRASGYAHINEYINKNGNVYRYNNSETGGKIVSIGGSITITDVTGLKHIIPIVNASLDLEKEYETSSSSGTLYSHVISTNGGKWKRNINAGNPQIPSSLIGTEQDYTYVNNETQGNLSITNVFKKQLEKCIFGVEYNLDSWVYNSSKYRPQWSYTYNNSTMVMIKWMWCDIDGNLNQEEEFPSMRNYNQVKQPQLNMPAAICNNTMLFADTWRIQKTDGTYVTVNSREYFTADTDTYRITTSGGRDYITLYANYTESQAIELRFYDDFLDITKNDIRMDDERKYVLYTVPMGTVLTTQLYNKTNPQISEPSGYQFNGWDFANNTQVTMNQIINGKWRYSVKFKIYNSLENMPTGEYGEGVHAKSNMTLKDEVTVVYGFGNDVRTRRISFTGSTTVPCYSSLSDSIPDTLEIIDYNSSQEFNQNNLTDADTFKRIYLKTVDENSMNIHYFCYDKDIPDSQMGTTVVYNGETYTYFKGVTVSHTRGNSSNAYRNTFEINLNYVEVQNN